MGIKLDDIIPNNPAFPDALNSVRKGIQTVAFGVTRSMTSATKVAVLAADSTMMRAKFYFSTASNAGTTATVTLTATYLVNGSLTTVTLGTVDVKGTTTSLEIQSPYFGNLELVPAATRVGDIVIKATYAETGTASTAGGPWVFTMDFIR